MTTRPLASFYPLLSASAASAVGPRVHASVASVAKEFVRPKGDLRMGRPIIPQEKGELVLIVLVEMLADNRYKAMTACGQPELVQTHCGSEALADGPPVSADTVRLRVAAGAGLGWLPTAAGQTGPGKPGAVAGLRS